MVSIMPCTSKKYEIQRSSEMFASGFQDIDAVLCTRELGRMIKQAGIDLRIYPMNRTIRFWENILAPASFSDRPAV